MSEGGTGDDDGSWPQEEEIQPEVSPQIPLHAPPPLPPARSKETEDDPPDHVVIVEI